MLVDGRRSSVEALRQLDEVWTELDLHRDFRQFAQLHWASLDLQHSESTHQWPGATRENIDDIIRQTAQAWLARFAPQENS